MYFEWVAIFFVLNGPFQRALQSAAIGEGDAVREIRRPGPSVTSRFPSRRRLRESRWRGCELRHLVASTRYNLAVRDACSPPSSLPRRSSVGADEKKNPVRPSTTGLTGAPLATVLPQSGAAFADILTQRHSVYLFYTMF